MTVFSGGLVPTARLTKGSYLRLTLVRPAVRSTILNSIAKGVTGISDEISGEEFAAGIGDVWKNAPALGLNPMSGNPADRSRDVVVLDVRVLTQGANLTGTTVAQELERLGAGGWLNFRRVNVSEIKATTPQQNTTAVAAVERARAVDQAEPAVIIQQREAAAGSGISGLWAGLQEPVRWLAIGAVAVAVIAVLPYLPKLKASP